MQQNKIITAVQIGQRQQFTVTIRVDQQMQTLVLQLLAGRINLLGQPPFLLQLPKICLPALAAHGFFQPSSSWVQKYSMVFWAQVRQ